MTADYDEYQSDADVDYESDYDNDVESDEIPEETLHFRWKKTEMHISDDSRLRGRLMAADDATKERDLQEALATLDAPFVGNDDDEDAYADYAWGQCEAAFIMHVLRPDLMPAL